MLEKLLLIFQPAKSSAGQLLDIIYALNTAADHPSRQYVCKSATQPYTWRLAVDPPACLYLQITLRG